MVSFVFIGGCIIMVCGVLFTVGYNIGFKDGIKEEKEKLITSIMTER